LNGWITFRSVQIVTNYSMRSEYSHVTSSWFYYY